MNGSDLLNGFKTTLDLGVDFYPLVPDGPTLPCVCSYIERWPMDPTDEVRVILWCMAGTVDTEASWDLLNGWLADEGPTSITQQLDEDNRLGGLVSSVLPVEFRNFGMMAVQDGRPRLLQAEYVCDVLR